MKFEFSVPFVWVLLILLFWWQVDYKSFLLDFKSLLKAEEEEIGENGEKKTNYENGKNQFSRENLTQNWSAFVTRS